MAMENPDAKTPSPEREDAIRLFTFLKELAELRYKTIRTVDEYDTVLWLNSVPRANGCYTAAWGAAPGEDAEELWVELKRPRLLMAAEAMSYPHPRWSRRSRPQGRFGWDIAFAALSSCSSLAA